MMRLTNVYETKDNGNLWVMFRHIWLGANTHWDRLKFALVYKWRYKNWSRVSFNLSTDDDLNKNPAYLEMPLPCLNNKSLVDILDTSEVENMIVIVVECDSGVTWDLGKTFVTGAIDVYFKDENDALKFKLCV